jgi:hypothetical protein
MDNIDKMIQNMIRNRNKSPEELESRKEYTSLFTQYLSRNNLDITDDYSSVVPHYFENSDDLNTKIQALKDCLEHNIDIEQSRYYIDLLEGDKSDTNPPPTRSM